MLKIINIEENKDLKLLDLLAENVITPAVMPPIPEKTPSSFIELLKEYH